MIRTYIQTRPQAFEIPVHLIAWGIVFALPIAMMSRSGFTLCWLDYIRSLIMVTAYAVVFYANYFILIPHFMFEGRIKECLAWNVILIVLMVIALHFGIELITQCMHPDRPPRHMGPPKTVFMLRDTGSMILTAGLSAAIKMSRRWRQMENARREAEKSRTEAELKNLRNQLNPHFLLNTLNNIYALIAFDATKAQQAVQELSKLLRHVLYDNQQQTVPLGKEMDFIRNYIELMRIRLSSNVKVETHIDICPDSRTEIAPLIFISLIENAFKHGISPTEPSYIHINFSEKRGEVHCEIYNSYYPKTRTDKSGSGIGLEQVLKRLELTYHNHYEWQHGISPDGKEYQSLLTIYL